MRFSPFLKLNNGFHYLGPTIPGAELNSKTLKLRKFFDLRPLSKVTGVSNIFYFLSLSFLSSSSIKSRRRPYLSGEAYYYL